MMKNFLSVTTLAVAALAICAQGFAQPNRWLKPNLKADANPLVWIKSDIDLSFYKGDKKSPKPASGRGPLAYPCRPTNKRNRIVHSAIVYGNDFRNEIGLVGQSAKFWIEYAPNRGLLRRHFDWTPAPLSGEIIAKTEEQIAGGNFDDAYRVFTFPVTDMTIFETNRWRERDFLFHGKGQHLTRSSTKITATPSGPSDDWGLNAMNWPAPTIEVRWHKAGEKLASKMVLFPHGQNEEKRFYMPRKTIVKAYDNVIKDWVEVASVGVGKKSLVIAEIDGAPVWLQNAYDRSQKIGAIVSGDAVGGTTVFMEDKNPLKNAGDFVSAAVGLANYIVSNDATEPYNELLPSDWNDPKELIRSISYDSRNTKPGKAPYGTPALPMLVTFRTSAFFRGRQGPANIAAAKAAPEAYSEYFYLHKVGMYRLYKRKQIDGDRYDKHGYCGPFRIFEEKEPNEAKIEWVGFYAAK